MADGESSIQPNKLFNYKGYNLSSIHTIERLDQMENYDVRDSDVFVVTYPKSGTIWMQNIIKHIYMDGDLQTEECELSYSVVPWLEITHNKINTDDRPSPRLFFTHLPYQLIPKALKNKKTKVIYVYRNPKDVAVSYYHFHKFANYLETPENFGTFLQTFLNGQVVNDCWFNHVRNWYNHRHEFNIMFHSYEEIIKDLRVAVLKFSNFLGRSLDNKHVDIIVERSTFKNMKSNPKSNYENIGFPIFNNSAAGFMRKGTVGDWKNNFTVAENEMFDRIFEEKMKNVPLKYTWEISD
ncbi:LOW QUALITY PROTEIN: amine sulfotransferase-like [Scyliorhinus canicula]|uniref:LOW QUALITY PROTEIN: amine sulfotransferase-like n=1 Tax=Scyliorhinus canicula TaxID=7830 RepID=UPI0018F68523|nr:LOW QUALITY PROTEIN: amine sulfotransferase-like [Scyliorhinus canicula]